MGSRFGGIKQVEPVGPAGEATLEYSIYDAARSGFDDLVFLIRGAIEADFRASVLARLPSSLRRRLAFQEIGSLLGADAAVAASARAKPWGTAHALLCAAAEIDAPFAVVNADDFYGRESLRLVHDFLASSSSDSREWCMAGYRLRNTTSPNGPVSRGLCSVDPSGFLLSVREQTAISQEGEAFHSVQPDGAKLDLGGDEVVSMNLWGLSPAVFRPAAELFQAFLAESADSPSAEFPLPGLIDALLARGEARVRVLPTSDAWFGLTYREDRPDAARRVAALHASGAYPSPLWGSP